MDTLLRFGQRLMTRISHKTFEVSRIQREAKNFQESIVKFEYILGISDIFKSIIIVKDK